MNAQKELLDHIKDRAVLYVNIADYRDYDEEKIIEGPLHDILPKLNFDYDNSFGSQFIQGTIWYLDGTWSERGEYDGSEWWEYKTCPPLPASFKP